MRLFLCHLLLISLLGVSIEGAADMAGEGHAHTEHAEMHADSDQPPATDVDADHCEHCCHGHVAGISCARNSTTTASRASDHLLVYASSIRNFGHAPPTPPPNT